VLFLIVAIFWLFVDNLTLRNFAYIFNHAVCALQDGHPTHGIKKSKPLFLRFGVGRMAATIATEHHLQETSLHQRLRLTRKEFSEEDIDALVL
jgi:hypothetical protein